MHALFWLKTPIHPNEMDEVAGAELGITHKDPVLHELVKCMADFSWSPWRPQPKCAVHGRRGVRHCTNTTSTTKNNQTEIDVENQDFIYCRVLNVLRI